MFDTRITTMLIHGADELEQTDRGHRPHRLPPWVREQYPDPHLLAVEAETSGVRIVVRTAARALQLVTHPTRTIVRGIARPRGRIELLVHGRVCGSDSLSGGDVVTVDPTDGSRQLERGPAHRTVFTELPPGDKQIELWLPHNESVELIQLLTDEPVFSVAHRARLWVHHGSSISQGADADGPTRIWPAVAARQGGVELRNLGLGGNALLDPFMARLIRDLPADVISVKVGINLVNRDLMRSRAFEPAIHGFLDTIRDGHPGTPLVMISPIFCGIVENCSGPTIVDPTTLGTDQVRVVATAVRGQSSGARLTQELEDGRLTLRRIRDMLAAIIDHRAGDPNLHYLDGTTLYGASDAVTHPLPDGLHPDDSTHALIGARFADVTFRSGGPFAAG